jgi:diguanylate cyclase (GGDEF)-like protein
MLVFPGVWSEHGLLGAGAQSAVWIWVFWHGGFPALVLTAMLVMARQDAKKADIPVTHTVIAAFGALLLVVVVMILATAGQDLLPPLIVAGDYHTLTVSLPGRLVPALNIAALASVLVVKRGRTVLGLGLSIAMLASLIDAILTLHAGARFSLGWYAARMTSVVAAFSVLAVYLREATWLYARVLKLNAHLEEKAAVDVLTGLFNRRYFDQQLQAALRDAHRRGTPASLLMLDVDHFKLYNDQYGHLGGDRCLQAVAEAIAGAARRPTDIATRYGGEEFAVILPSTDAGGAKETAERILHAVRALKREHKASKTAPFVTVSIGMATTKLKPGETPEDLIRTADAALYRAKSTGRDRVAGEEA